MVRAEQFKGGVVAIYCFFLTACGMNQSGPTDEQVELEVQHIFETTEFSHGYGGPLRNTFRLDSVSVTDKKVSDGYASIIAKFQVTCLIALDGSSMKEFSEKSAGECALGSSRTAGKILHFVKYESRWRAVKLACLPLIDLARYSTNVYDMDHYYFDLDARGCLGPG